MKRQILMLAMALVFVMTTGAMAQSTTPSVPPSQQVDQSGQPETGTGPDVDVDAGRNAEDGLVDVEVNRNADSDTAAQGNDTADTMDQSGTYSGSTTDTGMAADDTLPSTASGTPLMGLLGLLSLAGALVLRTVR
jgi:hypothetical protein